jgi:translation initiation factor 1
MSKKKNSSSSGIVFSTDPDFKMDNDESPEQKTLPPAQQRLSIRLDTKQRAGKAVTLVQGFTGTTEDLEDLGKKAKTFCGTGGSVKAGEIIIQGDQRAKLFDWLTKNGYKNARKI